MCLSDELVWVGPGLCPRQTSIAAPLSSEGLTLLSLRAGLLPCDLSPGGGGRVGILRPAKGIYMIQLFFVLRRRLTLPIFYICENVFTSSLFKTRALSFAAWFGCS